MSEPAPSDLARRAALIPIAVKLPTNRSPSHAVNESESETAEPDAAFLFRVQQAYRRVYARLLAGQTRDAVLNSPVGVLQEECAGADAVASTLDVNSLAIARAAADAEAAIDAVFHTIDTDGAVARPKRRLNWQTWSAAKTSADRRLHSSVDEDGSDACGKRRSVLCEPSAEREEGFLGRSQGVLDQASFGSALEAPPANDVLGHRGLGRSAHAGRLWQPTNDTAPDSKA